MRRITLTGSTFTLVAAVMTVGAAADTFVPVEQDRFTSSMVQTRCAGVSSDGEAAEGFGPFESVVGSLHDCPEDPTLAAATANQTSTIGGASMLIVLVAHYSAHSPGSVFLGGVSHFGVTFEVPAPSVIAFDGLLLGSGLSGGAQTVLSLSGAGGAVLDQTLIGPFPPGEATRLFIQEHHVLDPGVYTIEARASVEDAIDIADPTVVAESDLTMVVDVTILGDTNGDAAVDIDDLINVILCWGTDGVDCPGPGIVADANRDGLVDVLDLLAVILAFGI